MIPVADLVARLGALAGANGFGDLQQEGDELVERLVEGRTYVAVVGQFKRGKSSLINALVGRNAVPTGAIPVTRVPTVVRFGTPAVRIRTEGEWKEVSLGELSNYVSEEGNPGNQRGVVGAEVFVDSSFLSRGICLVDTPGLGSIEPGASAATHDVLPRVDAALLLLGADTPLTADELDLATRLLSAGQPLLVALGKADRATVTEQDALRAYAERALDGAAGFFVVSVVAPPGSPGNPDWRALGEALDALGRGRQLLAASGERGARRLAARIGAVLEEERSALLRPAAELAAHVARAERTEAAALQALSDLTPLLRADVERLRLRAEAEATDFVRTATVSADEELTRRAEGRLRADALREANAVARRRLAPWFTAMEGSTARWLAEVASRFQGSCEGLLRSAGDGAAEDVTLDLSLAVASLAARRFHFHDRLRTRAAANPFFDRWAPRRMGERRALKAARRYLADLLEVNAARAEGDLADRAGESVRAFEGSVRKALLRVTTVTREAARRARVAQEAGAESVSRRVGEVEAALAELHGLAAAAGVDAGSAG